MKFDTIGNTISWALMMGREMLGGTTTLTPALDAEVLLGKVLGITRTELFVHGKKVLSNAEYREYLELLGKRSEGMPVAYITGRKEFMSLPFLVDQRCLIPRPETELLVEKVIQRVREEKLNKPLILELGTGSGCISVALAHSLINATIVASDISAEALEIAVMNAESLGVSEKIRFVQGDLYEALEGESTCFHIVVSNPPYIAEDEISQLPKGVREFEPSQALWTGEEGLAVIRRIIEGARTHLDSNGMVALEINPRRSEAVKRMFETQGFSAIEAMNDCAGYERVIVAERKKDNDRA
jgi:release factor glutamine methyltransferase